VKSQKESFDPVVEKVARDFAIEGTILSKEDKEILQKIERGELTTEEVIRIEKERIQKKASVGRSRKKHTE